MKHSKRYFHSLVRETPNLYYCWSKFNSSLLNNIICELLFTFFHRLEDNNNLEAKSLLDTITLDNDINLCVCTVVLVSLHYIKSKS